MSSGAQLPIGSRSWDLYVKQWEVRTQRTFRCLRFCLSRVSVRFPNLTLLFQLSHATKRRLSTFTSPAAIPHYEDANAAKEALYSCPATSGSIWMILRVWFTLRVKILSLNRERYMNCGRAGSPPGSKVVFLWSGLLSELIYVRTQLSISMLFIWI